jgi:hypothetical protein
MTDLKSRLQVLELLDLKQQKLSNAVLKTEVAYEQAKNLHLQMYELERAQDVMNSDYFWQRHTELEKDFLNLIQ